MVRSKLLKLTFVYILLLAYEVNHPIFTSFLFACFRSNILKIIYYRKNIFQNHKRFRNEER